MRNVGGRMKRVGRERVRVKIVLLRVATPT